jgi:hypothetical protein
VGPEGFARWRLFRQQLLNFPRLALQSEDLGAQQPEFPMGFRLWTRSPARPTLLGERKRPVEVARADFAANAFSQRLGAAAAPPTTAAGDQGGAERGQR